MPDRHPPRHAARDGVRIIGGRLRRSRLRVATTPGLRPTPDRVRETVFNWLGQTLTGWRCLDLFAGSGVLGLEAASRGAAQVDLVERDPAAVQALRQACSSLPLDGVRVHAGDALQFAARAATGSYDLVFVDPPYASALQREALHEAARLLSHDGLAYVEAPGAAELAQCIDPAAWQPWRSGRAGQVHYALLRKLDLDAARDGSTAC